MRDEKLLESYNEMLALLSKDNLILNLYIIKDF